MSAFSLYWWKICPFDKQNIIILSSVSKCTRHHAGPHYIVYTQSMLILLSEVVFRLILQAFGNNIQKIHRKHSNPDADTLCIEMTSLNSSKLAVCRNQTSISARSTAVCRFSGRTSSALFCEITDFYCEHVSIIMSAAEESNALTQSYSLIQCHQENGINVSTIGSRVGPRRTATNTQKCYYLFIYCS